MIRWLFSMAMIFLFSFPVFSQDSADVRISFIHWNDFHAANLPYQIRPSQHDKFEPYTVGGSAVLKAYIDSLKNVNINPTVVFAGDEFQGSPISSFTCGQSQIDLMKVINPDVLTIGNHEFDYGSEHFRDMIRVSALNIISSNIFYKGTDSSFVPSFWIKEVEGVRIAFIGAITDELSKLSLPVNISTIYTKSVYETISATMRTIRLTLGEPDLWIVVSHCGFEQDTMLAGRVPDLDLIFGAHTHTVLSKEVVVGKTKIVQAGSKGRYIGEMKMTYSKKQKAIRDFRYQLIETRSRSMKPDSTITAIVVQQEAMIGKELDQVIGELKVDWKIPRDHRESNLGSFEADIFREYTGADIAFINNGGLRKELSAGPIRVRDIWEINPFNNTLVTVTIKGAQLIPMLTYSLDHAESFVQVSGIIYKAKKIKGKTYQIIDLKVGGKPIDPAREYTIVMSNYMGMQLDNIFGLKLEDHPMRDYGVSDREVIISAIKMKKIVDQETDGRIRFLE
jgi:5'-nucleotidase / UDP-sugar diphosphatase